MAPTDPVRIEDIDTLIAALLAGFDGEIIINPASVIASVTNPVDIDPASVIASVTNPVTVSKIDALATAGLLSTEDSLSYRLGEIERHLHNRERWYGKLAVQTATDWAENNLTPFRAISGNNAYGTDPNDEAQVLGTADTPIIAGNTRYDLHKLFIVDASSTSIYKLRIIYGTGTMADAITAEQYSIVMVKIDAAAGETPNVPVPIMMRRGTCGQTKIWIQAWNAINNATIDFFVGLHEYEG